MNTLNMDTLTNKEKVPILLQEYATLRQEIITRTTHGYQLVAACAVVLVWTMSKQNMDARFWLGVAIAVVAVLIAGWTTFRDIGKAAERLRELENEINHRAGEQLLVWETYWGGAVTGFFGQARPLTRGTKRADGTEA